MLIAICAAGFGVCILSVILIIVFYMRKKSLLIPSIVFLLGFLVIVGSLVLKAGGFLEKEDAPDVKAVSDDVSPPSEPEVEPLQTGGEPQESDPPAEEEPDASPDTDGETASDAPAGKLASTTPARAAQRKPQTAVPSEPEPEPEPESAPEPEPVPETPAAGEAAPVSTGPQLPPEEGDAAPASAVPLRTNPPLPPSDTASASAPAASGTTQLPEENSTVNGGGSSGASSASNSQSGGTPGTSNGTDNSPSSGGQNGSSHDFSDGWVLITTASDNNKDPVYHTTNCSAAQKIAPEDMDWFESEAAARADGRRLCGICAR